MKQTITLKRIIDTFRKIAEEHKQINDFGFGDIFELNGRSFTPTILWFDVTNSVVNRNSITYTFNVYVGDLYDHSDNDRVDVQSETMLILNDVITILRREEFIDDTFSYNATPFIQEFSSRLAGWQCPIEITTEAIYGACDLDFEEYKQGLFCPSEEDKQPSFSCLPEVQELQHDDKVAIETDGGAALMLTEAEVSKGKSKLPENDNITENDKIPVQTSQGSGVVQPINILTGLYSRYRVEDLLAGNVAGYTEGSATRSNDWSGNFSEFFSLTTGTEANSRAVNHYKFRGGYPQGNEIIPRANFDTERHIYATLDFRETYPESIVRIMTNRLADRYTLNNLGYGIEVRGGRVFVITRIGGGSGYQEFDTGYDVPNGGLSSNRGNTVFFVISLVNNHITVSANGEEIHSSGDNVPTGIGNQYPQLSVVVDRADLESTENVQVNVSELKLITERW